MDQVRVIEEPSMQVQLCKFQIAEFLPQYQAAVEGLVLPIQQVEFGVRITREEQSDLMNIASVFQQGRGNFWVALADGRVVGTVGLVDIGHNQAALKKMFVAKDFRGKESGVAAALINRAKDWCAQQRIAQIFLGTVEQMTAAHRFYEKNGFQPVSEEDLPENFPIVAVDSKFYVCNLDRT
jgi:N-acetylglutamate synthase-like GNAT family acetyltransferase